MTISECRKLLGAKSDAYNDAQITAILDQIGSVVTVVMEEARASEQRLRDGGIDEMLPTNDELIQVVFARYGFVLDLDETEDCEGYDGSEDGQK
jgi:hypothetical protein